MDSWTAEYELFGRTRNTTKWRQVGTTQRVYGGLGCIYMPKAQWEEFGKPKKIMVGLTVVER